jgi:hypothetical protein
MNPDSLPAEIHEFVKNQLHTNDGAEALLLLWGRRNETWTIDAVASALHLPSVRVRDTLLDLGRHGLLEMFVDGDGSAFQYRPRDPALERLVDQFARIYQDNRLEIIKLMGDYAIERVRNSATRTFWDAFLRSDRNPRKG